MSKLIIALLLVFAFVGTIVGVMIYALKKANAQAVDPSLSENKDGSTQEILPFEDIRDSLIHLGNHDYRAILSCSSINYGLKTSKEQDIVELSFQRFLNSLNHPISIYVQTRTMDNTKMLDSLRDDTLKAINDFPVIEGYGEAYFMEMENLYENIGNNKEKKKYIIVPFNEGIKLENTTDEEKYNYTLQEMKNRILIIKDNLESIGISAELLNTNDLIDLMYVSYHKDSVNHSENVVNKEFLNMIVTGENKLADMNDEAKLDWILYEAQTRLQNELMNAKETSPLVVKKAEIGIKNINIIRKNIAGYYKDKTVSN